MSSEQNLSEVWQIEVGGQIYEAPFVELSDWINEGSLQPTDKVRRGNLRWIEARRVPNLVPFFNAKETGAPMPVVVNTIDAAQQVDVTPESIVPTENFPEPETFFLAPDPIDHSIAVPSNPAPPPDPDFCAIHPDLSTVFVCDGCGTGFCKVCPNSYGGTVRICPFCGAMCRTQSEVVQKKTQTATRVLAISEGFGAADFFNALSHPFKFKVSLFFGAVMFAAFSVGQTVSSLGGIYMIVSAIFCMLLANMLTFGVLANTIDNFSRGNLDSNFMPSFEDFELWDDVVHPFFLSIAAYISAFGPFMIALAIGFYFVTSSASSQMDAFQQKVEKIPGTHYYDAQRTLDQSQQVKGVIGNINKEQTERLEKLGALNEQPADLDESSTTGPVEDQSRRETREQEELWEMAQQSRQQSFEAVVGKSPETQAKESEAMFQGFLNLAAPLVVIGAIFFLWGLFYFPAACVVAGYTRSFASTINPLIGLDTIKRLGGTYAKILMMELALVLASLLFGTILGAILSPLDLPGFGNIPAKFVGSLFSFYLYVVFSCVLGYAIFKKSDELQIQT